MDTLFSGIEITLQEVLKNKEARAALQRELLAQYKAPIISFTINMPGQVKLSPASRFLHKTGLERLKKSLEAAGLSIHAIQTVENNTGLEAFFSVAAEPRLLKKIACQIEDEDEVGRLFDMDVLALDGVPISRTILKLPQRKCFICEQVAVFCARSRRHTSAELLAKIKQIIMAVQG